MNSPSPRRALRINGSSDSSFLEQVCSREKNGDSRRGPRSGRAAAPADEQVIPLAFTDLD